MYYDHSLLNTLTCQGIPIIFYSFLWKGKEQVCCELLFRLNLFGQLGSTCRFGYILQLFKSKQFHEFIEMWKFSLHFCYGFQQYQKEWNVEHFGRMWSDEVWAVWAQLWAWWSTPGLLTPLTMVSWSTGPWPSSSSLGTLILWSKNEQSREVMITGLLSYMNM